MRCRAMHVATCCALAAALLYAAASGAAYPERPVRFVVPFAPGGTNDLLARIVAERLSSKLGQPFVVDNRAGANSLIGCEITARAAPDGYTLMIVAAGFAVNPSIVKKLPYDT